MIDTPDPHDHYAGCTPASAGTCRRDFNIAEACCARWARERRRDARRDPLRARGRRARATLTLRASCSATPNRLVATRCAGSASRAATASRSSCRSASRRRSRTSRIYQLGAVAMPLSILFGPDALEYRLQRQRGAASRSSTRARIANLRAVRAALPGACARRSASAARAAQGDVDWTTRSRARARRASTPVDTQRRRLRRC